MVMPIDLALGVIAAEPAEEFDRCASFRVGELAPLGVVLDVGEDHVVVLGQCDAERGSFVVFRRHFEAVDVEDVMRDCDARSSCPEECEKLPGRHDAGAETGAVSSRKTRSNLSNVRIEGASGTSAPPRGTMRRTSFAKT